MATKRQSLAPPQFVTPMAAVASRTLPQGPEWTCEVKWDGYRALIIKDGTQVTSKCCRTEAHTRSTGSCSTSSMSCPWMGTTSPASRSKPDEQYYRRFSPRMQRFTSRARCTVKLLSRPPLGQERKRGRKGVVTLSLSTDTARPRQRGTFGLAPNSIPSHGEIHF